MQVNLDEYRYMIQMNHSNNRRVPLRTLFDNKHNYSNYRREILLKILHTILMPRYKLQCGWLQKNAGTAP